MRTRSLALGRRYDELELKLPRPREYAEAYSRLIMSLSDDINQFSSEGDKIKA